jgi:bifunctional DNA-binding transcriptional regulator/antitoxin component of YhaV-PrlF toxin-antitoxin module
MSTLTITAKGQVTLKKDLLAHLGVAPGDRVSVEKLPDGSIGVRAQRPTGRLSDLFGRLDAGGKHLTIEEMNSIVEKGWAGEP